MGGGLYVHVPFCLRKCGYCDFYSVTAGEETRERYVALARRMIASFPRQIFDTVYFGGGTPPLVGARGIAAILEAASRAHALNDPEITVECNPETVDAAFFADCAAAGVNRVSIGLQSADEDQLRFLGRGHRPRDAADAVRAARRAGIGNVSLDVMLALPGQTESSLGGTLDLCAELGVPHVSAYLLSIEPDTRFGREDVGRLCPGEDGQARLYLFAVERLRDAGLLQYEVSNFARPGFESRHNIGYWTLRDYLGIGPAAHSFIGGRRRYFPRDLHALLAAPDPWALWADDGPGGGPEEAVMLGLRLRGGVDLGALRGRSGFDAGGCLERAAPLVRAGLMRRAGERLSLTPRGFLVSNAVIAALLEA